MPLTNEDILKLRAWMKANPMEESDHARFKSDSESDSEPESESDSDGQSESDCDEPVLGGFVPQKVIRPEQAEQIVPPPAPMLRRRCDRPGWKPRQ